MNQSRNDNTVLIILFATYAINGFMMHFGQLEGDSLINWLVQYYIGI